MEVKEIELSKLRHAYVTVKNYLEKESGEKVKSLKTQVEGDLLLSGDDNAELLEKFVEKFELEYKDFNYMKHFHSEGELFGDTAIYNLLVLSVWLPLKAIELATLNKLKIDKPDFEPTREVTDLTFKDLLTWYVEKEFKEKGAVKYVIKK